MHVHVHVRLRVHLVHVHAHVYVAVGMWQRHVHVHVKVDPPGAGWVRAIPCEYAISSSCWQRAESTSHDARQMR